MNSFGGFDVGLFAGYIQADNGAATGATGTVTGDPKQWGFGANVGYAGFTLGGGYRKSEDIGMVEGQSGYDWNVGLTYSTGPWTFGGQYGQTEYDLAARTDDLHAASVGTQYVLGPGINLGLAVQYFDWGTNSAAPAVSVPATNEAWNVMAGTSISF